MKKHRFSRGLVAYTIFRRIEQIEAEYRFDRTNGSAQCQSDDAYVAYGEMNALLMLADDLGVQEIDAQQHHAKHHPLLRKEGTKQ